MTPPAPRQGTGPGTSPRVRDPFPRARRIFPGRDDQVREVRRWLAGLLPGTPERDDVIVVAVELVTNAIRHTASGRGGLVVVEVTWCGPVLRVAVADGGGADGPRLPARPARLPADPAGLAECGRGLPLVRALAASTGVCGDHRGRLVWADIGWTGVGPATPPLPPPPPRPGRHRAVPGQARREAADQAGRGRAERALAVIRACLVTASGA